ncbi:MAG: glycosyltransferase [Defluviitaleaceae bacterium]|nr:glycosyltransferase [Defluviitaleaceae bacterium]
MNTLKLSIGMIVKNESRHLRNCLTALQPLMLAVESELIIADTGSTDDTVQIAKAFTSNVIEIPWNDSFAEARNYTLNAAKGEWYMFIDADEYLADATEFIKFFNTGICNKWDGALYFQRNYWNQVDFTELLVYRLYKMTPIAKFTGHVHETLPHVDKAVIINTYVHHYGYWGENDLELSQKKALRNFSLLEKDLSENPNNLTAARTIARNYMALGALDKAKTYVDKCLNIVKTNPNNANFSSVYLLHIEYYQWINTQESHQKILEIIKEYFILKPKLSIGDIDVNMAKAKSHFALKAYRFAAEAYIKAYELIQLHKTGTLDISGAGTFASIYRGNRTNNLIMSNIFECFMQLKDYNSAFVALSHMPIQRISDLRFYQDAISKSEQVERYEELFKRIITLGDEFIEAFDLIVRSYSNVAKIIQPFFDLYKDIMADYLIRHDLKENLSSVHQIIYHVHIADMCKKQGDNTTAMNHIKTAMRIDSRFVSILSSKLRG